jgi:cysteine-rich repeat protein
MAAVTNGVAMGDNMVGRRDDGYEVARGRGISGRLRLSVWILGIAGGMAAMLGCERPDACGDGVVGLGEACDDGNVTNGDGCSSTCQLDDNISTPGDDRAGFVMCSSPFGGPPVTCGPGLGCCNDPGGARCAASLTECQSPFDFQGCDGPEDCGSACVVGRSITACSVPGFETRCHVDADCVNPGDVCDRGSCPLFSLPTAL